MEGDSSSDDDVQESPLSPKLGTKKLKLNDGSSQDSLKETDSSSKQEKDETVDSGVSADKSESVSSDDRATCATDGPSNEVVNAAPSTSNVRTILLNITRPKRNRNYRKRKTPGHDSDSNDSSRDSDDLSAADSPHESRPDNSNSEAESDEVQRFVPYSDDGSPSSTHMTTSDSNDTSYVTDDMVMHSGDTDSDEEWPRDQNENEGDAEESKGKLPDVLLKTRPTHNYSILREIINREMGLTFPMGKSTKTDVIFEQKFYGSLHAIYRMKNLHSLCKHRGCVNCINFHPEGNLLASGSDDTNVVVWDWARNIALQTIKTGHKSNVFQSKFLYLNARSQLNIVTCARDGQVRLLQCPPSGSSPVSRRRLTAHARAAHKLHVTPHEPHVIVSAGEDGLVMQCDVRAEHATRLFHVRSRTMSVPLYSVCGHPLDPKELLVAGRDKFVRIYDRRKTTKPLACYCPSTFEDHQTNQKKKVRLSMMHLTCAVYSHDGSEILGSYNDDDIYLFDAKTDVYDKENTESPGYTHRYSGHRNSATFKGVSFFGPGSEYIVSGSDCSYIYIWEKKSEAIVQWMQGDLNGVVNCIEAHPRCPVMATSGLDKDVKIWMPIAEENPTYKGIEKVVRENVVSQLRSPLFNDFLPTLYSAWRSENRSVNSDDDSPSFNGGNIEFDGNVCTTF